MSYRDALRRRPSLRRGPDRRGVGGRGGSRRPTASTFIETRTGSCRSRRCPADRGARRRRPSLGTLPPFAARPSMCQIATPDGVPLHSGRPARPTHSVVQADRDAQRRRPSLRRVQRGTPRSRRSRYRDARPSRPLLRDGEGRRPGPHGRSRRPTVSPFIEARATCACPGRTSDRDAQRRRPSSRLHQRRGAPRRPIATPKGVALH